MADNKDETAKAAMGVFDAVAHALLTFLKNGAAFHAELGAKAEKVAEAALKSIKSPSNE